MLQTQSDVIIGLNQDKGKVTATNKIIDSSFDKEAMKKGYQEFNHSFRKEIISTLLKIQNEIIDDLQDQFRFSSRPHSTLNINSIEQSFFDKSQSFTKNIQNPNEFHEKIIQLVNDISETLIMYDLYETLCSFMPIADTGNLYLFMHEFNDISENSDLQNPLLLIEVELKRNQNEVSFISKRNIVIINTPAINRQGYTSILTIPRAVLFDDAYQYLSNVEMFIQNNYQLFDAFILEHSFFPIKKEDYPEIKFRIGLQVVQKENKKLLDYSELITHIDAGGGGKLVNFIKNYVSGNVVNTQSEVDTSYNEKYPRKSKSNLISTIPINLNNSQKRILVALENPKNEIIVVDGPPGTGKSHTIMAITYWANQNKKSLVVTSHKKAALDVIDNMMTNNFKKLHPNGKPSVLRLSENSESINNPNNTLAIPVVSAANVRKNSFNENAISTDIKNSESILEEQFKKYWENSEKYDEYIKKLFEYEQTEQYLLNNNIITQNQTVLKIDSNSDIDFDKIISFVSSLKEINFQDFSFKQLKNLFNKNISIDTILDLCNYLNSSNYQSIDINNFINVDNAIIEEINKYLTELTGYIKNNSLIFISNGIKFKFFNKFSSAKKSEVNNILFKFNDLKFNDIIKDIELLSEKNKNDLSLATFLNSLEKFNDIKQYKEQFNTFIQIKNDFDFQQKSITEIYEFFKLYKIIIHNVNISVIESLNVLDNYFSALLSQIDISFDNLVTLSNLFNNEEINKNIYSYIKAVVYLSINENIELPNQNLINEYRTIVHQQLENINDERLLNLNASWGDVQRAKNAIENDRRLKKEEFEALLKNISCIISTPVSLSKYFPMENDIINILIIDEASQVSIADSISLLLRAKQVVVFGDELQYGAVSAYNVNSNYSQAYFKEIISKYSEDFQKEIDEAEKEKLTREVSKELDEYSDENFAEKVYKPSDGTTDWLKTFSIRTSTLSFAKSIQNYSTSLNVHFRSFPEIIEYSNSFFYKPIQIPLVINRIRTKPITETLRFIKVETQGLSGQNINEDEIFAIKNDIEKLINNGFKGTIGIITSFKEQAERMKKLLHQHLPNYQKLENEHKLSIWFVADVQGEERDIIYYSFVEDTNIKNGDLRRIYPTIGGTADSIYNLKKQRLNVGFSRAKDTMVFVHSMPLENYCNTRLGDALKFYNEVLNTVQDNFIEDENIFESPAEKRLYTLIINTDFYKSNRDKIKLIAQFSIGKYLEQILNKYIPKYRVDFLMTLSEHGKEKSLIIEYDGIEYHTKNPEIVTEHTFSQQYLDRDIERQLELESYGYSFLRINKFTLKPKNSNENNVDILNKLLYKKFGEE